MCEYREYIDMVTFLFVFKLKYECLVSFSVSIPFSSPKILNIGLYGRNTCENLADGLVLSFIMQTNKKEDLQPNF